MQFTILNINGNASLTQCTVRNNSEIKGLLSTSSSKFEKSLDVFSNSIRLNNTKINNNLQIHPTDNKIQEVYLDNHSVVTGNIVFDEGHGKVYVRGHSKVGGRDVVK